MKYCPFCKSTYENEVTTCSRAECTGTGQTLRTLGDGPEARYDLHDRQADTGACELWRARDRVTQADVAFTIIAKMSDSEHDRVDAELRILKKVRHAHVAGVADTGRMADGRIFFVSESHDGTMLDASFDKGVWSFQRAKRVVRQVGEGLLEIHKLGVLHRDLSPRNVLISRTGEAKIVNMVLAPGGKSAGERDYLSPEQLAGRAVDRRANTYNLAAILYRLVTGHVARRGDGAAAAPADVVPPSQRCSTNGLNAEIDRVIMKALEAQPGNRQPTLRTFLAEVEALTAREGDAPKPAPIDPPAAKAPTGESKPPAVDGPAAAKPASVSPAPPATPLAPATPALPRTAVGTRLAAISSARPVTPPVTPPVKAPAPSPSPAPKESPPAPARSSTVAGFATLSRLEQEKLAERLTGQSADPPAAKAAPAAETGALAKDDIAKLLSAAKARPSASAVAMPRSTEAPAPPTEQPAAVAPIVESAPAPQPAAEAAPATETGALAKDDIAKLLNAAKTRATASEPTTAKAPEAPPAPADQPAAPAAAGGSLGRNDIASLLSAAKVRQGSAGEPAAPSVLEKPAPAPVEGASVEVKKKLIEQMVRQSKGSMPVVAPAPAPAPSLPAPVAEAPVALATPDPAAKPAAPSPSPAAAPAPKVVEPADSPDFVEVAAARYVQHQRQRRIVGVLIVVALGAGATFAKMVLGKHAPASLPHSAAAPEGSPPPPAEVRAETALAPAQAGELPAAAAGSAPALPAAHAALVINAENRPPAAPGPRKASDGQYKQAVAKRVSRGVGAYLQELKGIDRTSLVPTAPPPASAPPTSAPPTVPAK